MLGHRPLTLSDYSTILKRRGWIVLIPAIIFPIVAYAISFLLSPQYVSQTLVLIEQQKVPDTYVKPVVSEDLNARLASMREQILSRSRLQPIIEKYNLFGTSHMTMDDRIDATRKNIGIKTIQSDISRSGGLPGFYISYKASDPHTAQLVCGDITSLFINQNLQDRENSAQGTTNFLREQLNAAKRNLDDQDAKLAKFQQENFGRLPGEDGGNLNMLQSLNSQLDASTQALGRMEQDRSYTEALLSQQARELPSTVPGEQRVAPQTQQLQLQQLLNQEAELTNRYTDDYPDVIAVRRKIKDLREQLAKPAPPPSASVSPVPSAPRSEPLAMQQLRASIRSMDQGIASKKREQAQIQSQIRTYQDRIASSPVVQEQYKALTRDYQTTKDSYDTLLRQSEQARMAVNLEHQQQGEQFRITDEPNLPEEPTFPKRGVFAAGGLAFGILFGLGIIALLEFRDTAIRSEQDLWAFTKLPTLGVISLAGSGPSRNGGVLSRLRPRKSSPGGVAPLKAGA